MQALLRRLYPVQQPLSLLAFKPQEVFITTTATSLRGLEDLIPRILKPDEPVVHSGRDWKAVDLRQKSWDDLHKLWFVLLIERNRLNSEKLAYKAKSQAMPDPYRVTKVKKSMNRIKQVMSERVREHDDDPLVQQQLKDFINAL